MSLHSQMLRSTSVSFYYERQQCKFNKPEENSNTWEKTKGIKNQFLYTKVCNCKMKLLLIGTLLQISGVFNQEHSGVGNCYEENTLFIEDSLPVQMTIVQCFQSCLAVNTCKVQNVPIIIVFFRGTLLL